MRRNTSRLFGGLANVLVAISGALGIRAVFGALIGKGRSLPAKTTAAGVASTAPSTNPVLDTEVPVHQAPGQATIYDTPLRAGPVGQPAPLAPRPLPPLRPGWSRAKPEHIPTPTYAPSVLALGIVFILWGIISSSLISVIGLVLFFIALKGWIGELRHGH